jgi:AraC-like DNA-binding protein
LYELNRPMTTHAHREGHLSFYVSGSEASVSIGGRSVSVNDRCANAVNSWEPHAFHPSDVRRDGLFLVLYIDRTWFRTMNDGATVPFRFGRPDIEITRPIRAMINEVVLLLENGASHAAFDGTLYELTDACFAQSWRSAGLVVYPPASTMIDFRVRKSMALMTEQLGCEIEFNSVARDAGLSRPHFYKLFRREIGVTPNIYLNTLRMEKAIERLGQTANSITTIAEDLGFSCQSVFTRFFSSHAGMPPTDYRRAVQLLHS